MKSYTIEVDGFWTDISKTKVDVEKGVYFVLCATQNDEGEYQLNKLLYIGKSRDINDRLNGYHHKHADILAWRVWLGGFPVYYSGTIVNENSDQVSLEDLTRVESALIYDRDPPLNKTADKKFHHPETYVKLVGVRVGGVRKGLPNGFNGAPIHLTKDEERS